MDNGKKEYPVNGLEQDCTSDWGKRFLCYVNNIPGIRKFAKNQMNRRFRRKQKRLITEIMKDDQKDWIYDE